MEFSGQLTVIVYRNEKLKGMVDIESADYDITFADLQSHYGLQCEFNETSPKYKKLVSELLKITDAARAIDELLKSNE